MVLKRTAIFCIALALIVVFATDLLAGGYSATGIGARARGMGGAFRAVADDWSAVYYNPAGLARIEQSQLNSTFEFQNFRPSYDPDVNANGYTFGYPETGERYPDDIVAWTPNFSGVTVGPLGLPVTAAFSIFAPYDQNLTWDLYRFIPAYDSLNSKLPLYDHVFDLDVLDFHASIAKSFMEDRLHVGLGISMLRGDLHTGRIYLEPNNLGQPYNVRPFEHFVTYAVSDVYGFGFGADFGLLFDVNDKISIGANYRSQSTITMDGDITQKIFTPDNREFQNWIPGAEEELDTLFSGHTFNARHEADIEMTMPSEFGFGIAVKPSELVTLAADVKFTQWSELEDLDIEYTMIQGMTGWSNIDDMLTSLAYPYRWDDVVRFSAGVEGQVKDNIVLRGGYSYDQSPIPDDQATPLVTDTGDKHHISTGLSYFYNKFEFAAAGEIVSMPERDVEEFSDINDDGVWDNLNGTYKNTAYNLSLSVTLRF